MFDMITKEDYWSYLDKELVHSTEQSLKNIQDGFVLDEMRHVSNAKVLEIGGGRSRVLSTIARQSNECWNADDFGGSGNGPTRIPWRKTYRVVPVLLGSFSPELPNDYFDYVFSISVIEHVVGDDLERLFHDACRVLKPGGVMFHAIDLYLYSDHSSTHAKAQRRKLESYMGLQQTLPLRWVETPAIDQNVTFQTHFATNADELLYRWSVKLPEMRPQRAAAQNVSLKAAWIRTEGDVPPLD